MKKVYSLIIVMTFITYCSEAQLSVGLKAGVNLSSLKGDGYTDPEQKSLMGLAIGGLVNYAINEKISIQPELFFSQEGTQWKASDYEQKNRLNYLNIPVLVQYSDPSGFFVHTGPQISLLLSAKMKFREDDPFGDVIIGDDGQQVDDDSEIETTDMKGFHASAPVSWGLGAGYIHESGFGINARYNIGLTNTLKKSADGNIKSSVFNIGLIYRFDSMKK